MLERVHMDIGHGDCKAIGGGARYSILFVDHSIRKSWIYALQDLTVDSITRVFKQFKIEAGALPMRLYTDLDDKILGGNTSKWLLDNGCSVVAAPAQRQNQNGLVERTWATACAMARAYITDMQMPRTYWYWALRQAIAVMN